MPARARKPGPAPRPFSGGSIRRSAARKRSETAAALAAVKRAKEIEDTPLQLCELADVDAVSGNAQSARRALRVVIEGSKGKRAPQHLYRIARIYATLGEADSAFASLEKAVDAREENLVWLKVDPHFDNLRSDSRFNGVLRRIGFAPVG